MALRIKYYNGFNDETGMNTFEGVKFPRGNTAHWEKAYKSAQQKKRKLELKQLNRQQKKDNARSERERKRIEEKMFLIEEQMKADKAKRQMKRQIRKARKIQKKIDKIQQASQQQVTVKILSKLEDAHEFKPNDRYIKLFGIMWVQRDITTDVFNKIPDQYIEKYILRFEKKKTSRTWKFITDLLFKNVDYMKKFKAMDTSVPIELIYIIKPNAVPNGK